MCTCYWTGIHERVVAVIFSILTSVSWDFLIAPGVGVECPWGAGTRGFVYVNAWIRVLNTLLVKAEQTLLQVETKCTAKKKYWIKKRGIWMNMVTINTTSLTVHFAQHTSECKRNKTNNKNKGFTRVKEKILLREKI